MSKRICFLFLTIWAAGGMAQNTKLSIDAYGGVPVSLTYFSPSVSTFGGVGLKYTLLREVSLNTNLSIGTLSGKNNSANAVFTFPDNNNNYLSFSNNFIQYTAGAQVNLESLLNLRRILKRINPYLNVGGGIIRSNAVTNRVGGSQKKYDGINFYTAYVGLEMRYYLNPTLDILVNCNYNIAQTYYTDAVPLDQKLDNYLLNAVGVSYKLGSRKDKQHIDWNNVILRDRIYIPDIEKRQGQPLDAAGNYFVFHKDSIAKLQAQNAELLNKTKELEEKAKSQEAKTAELQNKSSEQQKQLDSIQGQMNTLKQMMDTLRNQRIEYVPQPVQEEPKTDGKEPKTETKDTKPVTGVAPNKDQQRQIESLKRENQVLKSKVDDLQKQINEIKKNNDTRNVVPKEGERQQVKPSVETNPKHDMPAVEPAKESKKATEEAGSSEMPSNSLTEGLNKIDNVVPPVARYNIIAGAYAGEKYAMIFRDKMRAKGYEAAVFKSDVDSRILRVCIFTTQDKAEALSVLRKARTSVDPKAWIHVYYQK